MGSLIARDNYSHKFIDCHHDWYHGFTVKRADSGDEIRACMDMSVMIISRKNEGGLR